MRKLVFITFFVLLAALLGWWYFREQQLPDYGPLYREYAYVTNGKSDSVTVIDLRTFEPAKTIAVGSDPTGVAANTKKNEIYVVNTGSNNVSVIDAERNDVVATIGVHGTPYFIDVSEDGKRAYVANSASNNVSVINLDKRLVLGNIRVGISPGRGASFARWRDRGGQQSRRRNRFPDRRRSTSDCAVRLPLASSRKILPSCPTTARPSWPAPVPGRWLRST